MRETISNNCFLIKVFQLDKIRADTYCRSQPFSEILVWYTNTYNFMEVLNVTDFPIRDHKVILQIRCRRRTDIRTGTITNNLILSNHYNGYFGLFNFYITIRQALVLHRSFTRKHYLISNRSASFHAGNLLLRPSKSARVSVQVRVTSSRLPASANFLPFGEKIMESPR